MIRNVLESIEGIGILPTIALIIFVVAFLAMIVWVISLPRKKVDKMSRIPFDEKEPIEDREGTNRDD